LNKITLDRIGTEAIRKMEEDNLNRGSYNMLSDIANYFESKYPYFAKEIMLDLLKQFSNNFTNAWSVQAEFNYNHLITVLYKLYPGEFQKELIKK